MRLLFHFLQVVAVLVVVAGDLSLFMSTVFIFFFHFFSARLLYNS